MEGERNVHERVGHLFRHQAGQMLGWLTGKGCETQSRCRLESAALCAKWHA